MFSLPYWHDMWRIRLQQLSEEGIAIDVTEIPASPEAESQYDTDLHQIEQVYTNGRGGFWLAYSDEEPVGYVGLQDIGKVAELRRMYVAQSHRRQGIGRKLCEALIAHSGRNGFEAIELWTAAQGAGRRLYESLGFVVTPSREAETEQVEAITKRKRAEGEIRMRRSR